MPALRRRWLLRLGWYPGDWIWVSLLGLLVATAGAVAAILVAEHRGGAGGRVIVATTAVGSLAAPTPVPTTTGATPRRRAAPPRARGRISWPPGENGWTVVLVSYPSAGGRQAALAAAARAASAGLRQVGIVESSLYASLQPGYLVVFAGVYGTQSDADIRVATARQAGFAGAYSRRVAR